MSRSRSVADCLHGVLIALILAGAPIGQALGAELEGAPLQLEVFLNGESTKLIGSFTRLPDGKITAKRKELVGLGINPPTSGGEDEEIALDQIDGFSYRYDEPRQRLDATINNDRRTTNQVDGRGNDSGFVAPRTQPGAVLNYLLFASSVSDESKPINAWSFAGASAQFDGRLFSEWGTLSQTGIAGQTVSQSTQGIRLDSTYSYFDAERAVTYRAGDMVSATPSWARPVRMGGVQVERNFGLRPDIVTTALPTFSGTAAAPTTIDVYVNNVRTFSRDLPVGPYSVSNIPGLSGTGQAEVVMRDASGREVKQSLPFYTSPKLLGPGMIDFSLQAGFARYNYALTSFDYGVAPLFSAASRYGLNSNFTLEAYGEMGAGMTNIGAGLVTNAFDYAALSFAGRWSRFQNENGFMGYAALETKIGPLTLSASTQRTFGNFQDLASVTARQAAYVNLSNTFTDWLTGATSNQNNMFTTFDPRPPIAIDRISASMPGFLPRSGLSASYLHTLSVSGAESHIGNIAFTKSFENGGTFSLNAFADFGTNRSAGLFAGFTMPIGRTAQSSAGMSVNRDGGLSGTGEVIKPLGFETGSWGARSRISADTSQVRVASGAASYRSAYGRGEVTASMAGGVKQASIEFEGAIATVDKTVALGQRIDDSFALVDVGAPNVDVIHRNRRVGTSDSRGILLVPNLAANQKNLLTIDTSNLPIGAHIESTQALVTPASQGAVKVDFGVRASERSAIILLRDTKGVPLRAGLKGKIEGSEQTFMTGHDGRAFVRDLPDAGTLVIDTLDAECRATFAFPTEKSAQPTIGPLPCQ